jgi:hypothetical protein
LWWNVQGLREQLEQTPCRLGAIGRLGPSTLGRSPQAPVTRKPRSMALGDTFTLGIVQQRAATEIENHRRPCADFVDVLSPGSAGRTETHLDPRREIRDLKSPHRQASVPRRDPLGPDAGLAQGKIRGEKVNRDPDSLGCPDE